MDKMVMSHHGLNGRRHALHAKCNAGPMFDAEAKTHLDLGFIFSVTAKQTFLRTYITYSHFVPDGTVYCKGILLEQPYPV